MSMAELMESITDELTEQMEHDAFARYMNPLTQRKTSCSVSSAGEWQREKNLRIS